MYSPPFWDDYSIVCGISWLDKVGVKIVVILEEFVGVVFDDGEMGSVAGLGEFGLGWLGGDAVCGFGGRVLIVAAGDDEHAGNTDLLDEGGVVADHDDCAGVIFEVFADDFLSFGIKVIRRLIKDNKIGALEQDLAKCDPSFLAGR